MTIKCILDGKDSMLIGPFPFEFIAVISTLSGGKRWKGSEAVIFEDSADNINKLRKSSFVITYKDTGKRLKTLDKIESLGTQHVGKGDAIPCVYKPKQPWFKEQQQAISISWNRENYALFWEMGLGKSAVIIGNAGILFKAGLITGLLIISPKGVHEQWIDEQFPEHLDPSIQWDGKIWNKKNFYNEKHNGVLHVLSINIDALIHENGFEQARQFLRLHNMKTMTVIDESQKIKTFSSDRTQKCMELKPLSKYRRLLTGTPIAKSLVDVWSQFKFLDEDIIGHRYKSTFVGEYCVRGGYQRRDIVGHQNVEQFYMKIAPHSYRLTKKEATDLPIPRYQTRKYQMSPETRKHFLEFKQMFLTQLENGTIVKAANAQVGFMRLQEITLGYIRDAEKNLTELGKDRLEVLMDMVDQINGKIVIWCRFKPDVVFVTKALSKVYGPKSVVQYYGDTRDDMRNANKKAFVNDKKVRFLVGTAKSGGAGLNLQGDCENTIYYSNDFNSLDRWQSEGRVHRRGMKGGMTYWDIVAKGGVDSIIINNLKRKRSLSDLTLDEIRLAVKYLED